jgi:hypothetical protein
MDWRGDALLSSPKKMGYDGTLRHEQHNGSTDCSLHGQPTWFGFCSGDVGRKGLGLDGLEDRGFLSFFCFFGGLLLRSCLRVFSKMFAFSFSFTLISGLRAEFIGGLFCWPVMYMFL